MKTKSSSLPPVVVFLLWILGIYVAYHILIFLAKFFTYTGFNTIFYTDNMLRVAPLSPLFMWALLGAIFGSIAGIVIAIKKYKLPRKLIAYPVGVLILFIIVMIMINKPGQYSTTSFIPSNYDYTPPPANTYTPTYTYNYRLLQDMNVRTETNTRSEIAFTVKKGVMVEVSENGIIGEDRGVWGKISYEGKTGYIKMKYLKKVY